MAGSDFLRVVVGVGSLLGLPSLGACALPLYAGTFLPKEAPHVSWRLSKVLMRVADRFFKEVLSFWSSSA